MADLVRVLVNDQEVNVSPAWAKARGLKVIDEPTHNTDGTVRRTTPKGGRPGPRTADASKAPEKKAAVTESAPDQKGSDK